MNQVCRNIRVALDAGPLVLSSGGLLRYVSELSCALSHAFPEDEFVLLSDQPFSVPSEGGANLRAGSPPNTWWEKRWWFWGANRAIKQHGIQVFHGTDFAVPYRAKAPSVLTLHDLSPWKEKAWHTGADRVRTRAPRMIQREATMVITPSEAVRKEAIAHFQLVPERVVAVPHAANSRFRPVNTASQEPYFLFVGTLEPRKNLRLLLGAWRSVRGVKLVIAGRQREDFAKPPDEPGVEWLGEVPEQQLPELYSGALAVIYPSLYEGFGLPVLEAMQCGACVITSRDPAILEVSGGAAIHAGTGEELAAAMRAIAESPEQACPWRERALRRASEFSWERTAFDTRAVYEEAIRRFGHG